MNKKIRIRILVHFISRLLIRYRYHDMISKKIRTRFWSWYGIDMNKKIRIRILVHFITRLLLRYRYHDITSKKIRTRLLIRYRYHDMISKKIRTRFWSWYGIGMGSVCVWPDFALPSPLPSGRWEIATTPGSGFKVSISRFLIRYGCDFFRY